MTIDDRPAAPASAGALPAGTRKVQIDYTALRLTAPGQTRFRYRLDGFDPDWVDAGARRQAYYTNLAPGRYVFRVQAHGDGGAWTVPEAQWPFAVRPAFHQTGWFYALCGLALLLAAWGVAHTRVWILNRQFAATLAERTRLSREIHDTMLQSLAGIALQVQAIARQCAPEAAEQQSQLVALRRQVEEYMREARQAIQNLRSPMLEASAASRGRSPKSAAARSRRRRDSTSRPTRSSAPRPAIEGELLRIAQEAITNAARHAGATTHPRRSAPGARRHPAAGHRRRPRIRRGRDAVGRQRSLWADRDAGAGGTHRRPPHRHEFGQREPSWRRPPRAFGGARDARRRTPPRRRASRCCASTIIASSAKACA